MSGAFPEPFSIPESERSQVVELQQLLEACGVSLIGLSGTKFEMPETLHAVYVAILALLGRGDCFHVIVRKHAITTEHAAWILGMSRPLVVKLLQTGALPYHRVGNRRRIYLDDILEYLQQRDFASKTELAERVKQN
jgi:excisionase family DNA binding protein